MAAVNGRFPAEETFVIPPLLDWSSGPTLQKTARWPDQSCEAGGGRLSKREPKCDTNREALLPSR